MAIDFIIKLLELKEPLTGIIYDSILVVNDTLTKYAHFILYKEVSDAAELAYILTKNVFT